MNGDEHARGSHYSANRKPGQSKNLGYSPSTNYNYNSSQTQHGNHNSHGNTNYNAGNKPHHRKQGGGGSFKRDSHGSNDKLVKQNDLIIRLLKEIRDRLPEPPEKESGPDENEKAAAGSNDDVKTATVEASEKSKPRKQENDKNEKPAPGNEAPKKSVQLPSEDEELDSKVNGNI